MRSFALSVRAPCAQIAHTDPRTALQGPELAARQLDLLRRLDRRIPDVLAGSMAQLVRRLRADDLLAASVARGVFDSALNALQFEGASPTGLAHRLATRSRPSCSR